MNFEIRHPRKRLAAWLLLSSGAATYLALVTTQFMAATFSQIPRSSDLRIAVKLDPLNAEYRDRLGRFELLAEQAPAKALPWLQTATALGPNNSGYWLDRAIAEQLVGDLASERNSLQHVVTTDPHSAGLAWQVANLYLAQGATDSALLEYRKVLENDPVLTLQVLQVCWRIRPDIDFLLQHVISTSADQAFLAFLVSKNEPDAAAKVWERIVSLQQPVDRRLLFDYLQHLFAENNPSQAARVWQEAANLSGLAAYQPSAANLVVNGDFSLDILNGGFDWSYQKTSAVSLAIDPFESHSGSRSLHIIFDGQGIEDAGIRQLISVEPDTAYQFSAYYKAQEMDGAGAPKFAIQDRYNATTFFMSDDLRNTESWIRVNGGFTTGPETRLVVLRVARVPVGRPIRGKLWIDDLRLLADHPVASATKGQP
jgi:tetratricopeptide (TPR) repeat protein